MLKLYDYTGVIHFHSEYSFDGRIPVVDIIRAARENNIDFLMLTDHSCLDARENGMEGWNDDVLLVVGQEITPRFNHYIAFGIDEPVVVGEEDENIPPQSYIDKVRRMGGIGFMSHPDHEGTEMFHVKHFPWVDWTVSGYTGIGIWDFMTDWQSTLINYPRALCSYLFPALFLRGPRSVTLKRWDKLNQQSKIVGIGELDNHDTLKRIFGLNLSVFPFGRAFKFIRTHILTDEPFKKDDKKDIELILESLKKGRAYIAMEYFRETRGFSFFLFDTKGKVTMGDEFHLKRNAAIHVEVPEKGKIRVVKDGHTFQENVSDVLECTIDKTGMYRVEVFLKKLGKYRPWIFSNPIYVK